jgi:hypothetical protein
MEIRSQNAGNMSNSQLFSRPQNTTDDAALESSTDSSNAGVSDWPVSDWEKAVSDGFSSARAFLPNKVCRNSRLFVELFSKKTVPGPLKQRLQEFVQ